MIDNWNWNCIKCHDANEDFHAKNSNKKRQNKLSTKDAHRWNAYFETPRVTDHQFHAYASSSHPNQPKTLAMGQAGMRETKIMDDDRKNNKRCFFRS